MLSVWRHRQTSLEQKNHAICISRLSMWPKWAKRKCWGWGCGWWGWWVMAGGGGWSMLCFGPGYWVLLCWYTWRSAGIAWWHKSLKCSEKLLMNQHNSRIIITWFFYLLTEYGLICIGETYVGVETCICAVPFTLGYRCWIWSFIHLFIPHVL